MTNYSLFDLEFLNNARNAIDRGESLARVVEGYCAWKRCSNTTAYNFLKKNGIHKPRKRRSDAGNSAITEVHLEAIAKLVNPVKTRKNNRSMPLKATVEYLKKNGTIPDVSYTSYARAYKEYERRSKHKEHINLRSKYPNHCWQIDSAESGLDMAQVSPGYLRYYIVADHYSSLFWVLYGISNETVETSKNYLRALWGAMRDKGNSYCLAGTPELLYCTRDKALQAVPFTKTLDALQIGHFCHLPHNPLANGTVKSLRGWWKRKFEALLFARGIEIVGLDHLNELAFEEVLRWNSEPNKSGRFNGRSHVDLYLGGLSHAGIELKDRSLPPDWPEVERIFNDNIHQ